jgi:hypothetical protein
MLNDPLDAFKIEQPSQFYSVVISCFISMAIGSLQMILAQLIIPMGIGSLKKKFFLENEPSLYFQKYSNPFYLFSIVLFIQNETTHYQ